MHYNELFFTLFLFPRINIIFVIESKIAADMLAFIGGCDDCRPHANNSFISYINSVSNCGTCIYFDIVTDTRIAQYCAACRNSDVFAHFCPVSNVVIRVNDTVFANDCFIIAKKGFINDNIRINDCVLFNNSFS